MAFGAGEHICLRHVCNRFCLLCHDNFLPGCPQTPFKIDRTCRHFPSNDAQLRQKPKSGDSIQKILTWGNLLVLAILIGLTVPDADPKLMRPMFPKGLEGIGSAIAIIYVSFFGSSSLPTTLKKSLIRKRPCPWPCFCPCSSAFYSTLP